MYVYLVEACIANKHVSEYEVYKQSVDQLVISSVQTYRTAVVCLMLGDTRLHRSALAYNNKVYFGGLCNENSDPVRNVVETSLLTKQE